jgi:hypothetical protein
LRCPPTISSWCSRGKTHSARLEAVDEFPDPGIQRDFRTLVPATDTSIWVEAI